MPEHPWQICSVTVTGPSHAQMGEGCQDRCGIGTAGPVGEVLLLAIADGAGSAKYGAEGAALVVETWLAHFTALFSEKKKEPTQEAPPVETEQHDSPAPLSDAGPAADADSQPDHESGPAALSEEGFRLEALEVLRHVREGAQRLAEARGCDAGEFNATLLGAVLLPGASFFGQVGDGCWVGSNGTCLGCLTWPTAGEFASQTVFAGSRSAPEVLQCVVTGPEVRAIAGFTDGVERIALQLAQQLPEPGFFGPVFESVRQSGSALERELAAFLESERVCAESDDDKTLLILVRPDELLR